MCGLLTRTGPRGACLWVPAILGMGLLAPCRSDAWHHKTQLVPVTPVVAAPAPAYYAAPAPLLYAAPAPTYYAAPAPAPAYYAVPAAAPAAGYIYYYGSGAQAQPASNAAAPGAGLGSSPPGGLTDAQRSDVIDKLKSRLTILKALGAASDDIKSQLQATARDLYASKLGITVDQLSPAVKQDAEAVAAAIATGGSVPASSTGSSQGTSTAPGTSMIPLYPVVPVQLYAAKHHPFCLCAACRRH